MKLALDVIDAVRIDAPCPMSWDGMTGDRANRHCDRCDKTVHDLSEMTATAGAALFSSRGDHLCVRLTRHADGTPVTLDTRPESGRWWVRRIALAVGSWLGLALVTGCGSRTLQGAICSPEEAAANQAKALAAGMGAAALDMVEQALNEQCREERK
jgi:hypothetical protein